MRLCIIGAHWMKVLVAVAFISLLGITASPAQTMGLAPNVQQGVDWLGAQVQGDGSLATENASIATPFQAREEVARTLGALATAPDILSSAVAANTDANVEYTARRILAAGSGAQSADIAALLAMQNPDGGWGLDAGFQSDSLDTAFALDALSSGGAGTSAAVASGLSNLAQAANGDGGWGINGQSSIYATSYVVLAASAWSSHFSTIAMADAASAWLLAQRNGNSQAYSATLDNALALAALSTQASHSSELSSMVTVLNAAQLADGSWAEDPYLTAVALHALWYAAQPAPPEPTGSVGGTVVDQSTGQPIAGATVQAVENSAATVSSGTDGSFSLGGLPSGAYTLRVTNPGYQASLSSIQITASQVLNLGVIALVPAPSTATLSGIVKNSSGNPLQNAVVAVETSSVSTSAAGAYQITGLTPASATITVSLSGYQTVTAAVNVVAGNSYTFSPTLYTNTETVPGTSLQGTVFDRATGNPIPGAIVMFNGTTQVTDANGNFLFADAAPGSFSVQITAPGYLELTATGTLAAGVNNLGKVALTPAPTTARLSGIVKDSNGAPIQNVLVSAGSSSAVTDATGTYQIADLSPGSTAIAASLSGYQTATTTANLVAGDSYTFSPTLYSTSETAPGTSLQGIVVNATTHNPLAGATVVLNGVSQTTDANGKFLFAGATAGDFAIQITLSGYFAANGTGTLAQGVNDLGTIALSPAPAATAYQTIASTGPLNRIFVGADLSSQVTHTGDSSDEVYPPGTVPGDFGTFIVVGASLYAPHFNSRGTATGSIGTYKPFILVSQIGVLGTGASSDPFSVSTVANVGTTGLTIQQLDSYVIGQEAFRSDVTVTNTTNIPVSAILYRAMDCYLGNSDSGYGLATGVTVGCTKQPNNTPAGRIEEFVPLTGGANYYEAGYSTIWSVIGSHKPFPNKCDCTSGEDNGMGLSWTITVPANSSLTYSNLTVFSPLGNQPLVVTKTADSATAAPGDSDGYTIKVSNLNARALPLYSITDSLPTGFVYITNSSNGATTSDPVVSGQSLTWNGPFNIPANGNVTLHFAATVPTTPGTYYNQATANSGTNIVVPTGQTAPVTVNAVSIGVVTDRASYPVNATAQVTTTLNNFNAFAVSGNLAVDVYDAAGAHVGSVNAQQVDLPASGNLPVTAPFAIGTILPGQYTVTAVLTRNGQAIATASTTFDVLPDNSGASATSAVKTDKQVYNPTDTVTIDSRVVSQSANLILSDLTLVATVFDAGGTMQFNHSYSIAQLLPGAFLDFSVPETLANAAPGTYTVKQDLLDSQGNTYSHVETTYLVSSTGDTGFGLTGAIAVTPKSTPIGQALTLTASATNHGNGALNDLPLTISIVDPDQGTTLQQFSQTSTLGVGGSVPFNATWTAQGTVGATYFAVLTATVGNGPDAKTLTLASDTFTLSAPPVHLEADVSITASVPPLAALVLTDSDFSPDAAGRVASSLAALNYTPVFVNTAQDFASGLRSGTYQVYLLLATQVMPDATTLRLLREAVHRGEGVIAANGAATLPDALAQIAGLTASAALPAISAQTLDVLPAAPGGAANLALSPALPARVVTTTSAQARATLTGRLSSTPDQGTLAHEVADIGRVDIGYFGSDAGTGGTHLSLTSMGRIRNADGTDRYTVWRIRNSGSAAPVLTLSASDATYSLSFTSASHTDTYLASPDVAGSAAHVLSNGSQAIDTKAASSTGFADSTLVETGVNPGAIALWANSTSAGGFMWSGAQHELHGALHSNSDITLSGSQNVIDGPVHYVANFVSSGAHNTYTFPPRRVAAQPMPILMDLGDFAPGGAVQQQAGANYFDESAECVSKRSWTRQPKDMPLPSGVYWIPCGIHISGSNGAGTVTLVTTGSFDFSGSKANFQPYYEGVQFATTGAHDGVINMSGSNSIFGGLIFAPQGSISISGSSLTFRCALIGDQIRLSGAKATIDSRQCEYATVQRQVPAVLWSVFGAGHAAYSVFDWQTAVARYETTPGPLSGLFDSSLGNVAPTDIALRAGSVLPLVTTVTNTHDPFLGQLTLSADDDSLFVPSAATWPLDFTSQNLFVARDRLRLGMGSSSTVTATVSAATPLVVNPLKTADATVAHLPGETIGDLLASLNAISNRDAALNAALTALQAAQITGATGDGEAALASLLDAAEACGQSANGQADALRTRIDWVIWSGTH